MSTKRRGRSSGPTLTVIYWRDIPAQVTVKEGRETAKHLLPPRFQHAIDRAAMVADKSDTESYVAEWRQESRSFTGDAAAAIATEAERIETTYDRDRIAALVEAGGTEPASTEPASTEPASTDAPPTDTNPESSTA